MGKEFFRYLMTRTSKACPDNPPVVQHAVSHSFRIAYLHLRPCVKDVLLEISILQVHSISPARSLATCVASRTGLEHILAQRVIYAECGQKVVTATVNGKSLRVLPGWCTAKFA
jgi:hypothetical protein